MMTNARLSALQPYPFERLNKLLENVIAADMPFISLALGEPKHETAQFLVDAYRDEALLRRGFGTYPPTKGLPELRQAMSQFITRRYGLPTPIDPETELLPVSGSREGLFALAQALIDPSNPGTTLMPNPFYQIYEGAAVLAGSKPIYMNCTEETQFLPNLDALSEQQLTACKFMYLCTPGNPTGAIMELSHLRQAIELALQYDFILVSDECYSEIYADEQHPPPGLLEACAKMGNLEYKNCVTLNSLSKRSNLPGLRSGYVAGDAELIRQFLLYRTYHGAAMPVHSQLLSALAWQDETHVEQNRSLYRQKYQAVGEILGSVWPMQPPPASFYLWPEVPNGDDPGFAKTMLQSANIKVLPGSYLSRQHEGINPGANRIRMALVASLDECVEAATRIKSVLTS